MAAGGIRIKAFLRGLKQEESGDYTWKGNEDGAMGAYQILASNWPSWAKEAGVDPNDHSKAAQDAVAEHRVRSYLHQFGGNWALVAAAWLGGAGGAQEWEQGGDPTDGHTSTSQYVANVLGFAGMSTERALEIKPSAAPLGTIPGNTSSSGGDPNATTPVDLKTPKGVKEQNYLTNSDVSGQYGYLSAYIHNPQIGPILAEAAKGHWSQDRLLGALSKTQWWKNTNTTSRAWEALKKIDPGTAQHQLTQERNKIQQLAVATLGHRLDPARTAQMANASLAGGWSDAMLQEAVGAEFKYQGAQAKYKGAAGQTIDTLQAMGQSYLVPISKQSYENWTKQVLEGTSTTDDFKSYLQSQAESLFPTLASSLKGGQTVQQYLDPYAQMASQILEKPTGAFNFENPKWGRALNTVQPDGQRAPMTLSAWGDYLRSTPDYQKTDQARQQAAAFGESIANIFGKVSNGISPSDLGSSGATP